MSAIKGADIETFTFAMWQIRLYLLCKLNSPEAMVIKCFQFCDYFLWV